MAVCLEPKIQQLIQDKIISLGHQISGKKLEHFKSYKIALKPKALAINGRAGWDSKLSSAPTADRPELQEGEVIPPIQNILKDEPAVEAHHAAQPSQPTCFSCPACGAAVLSNVKSFQLKDLDKTCKCRTCCTSSKVGRWKCKCQLPWHLCTTHVECCSKASLSKRERIPVAPKKRIAPQSFEQLIAFDNQRAANQQYKRFKSNKAMRNAQVCKPVNILPPQANLLSQKLRDRFAYLLNK